MDFSILPSVTRFLLHGVALIPFSPVCKYQASDITDSLVCVTLTVWFFRLITRTFCLTTASAVPAVYSVLHVFRE